MSKSLYKHSIQHFVFNELPEDVIKAIVAPWKSKSNDYITETAGFIPLVVKFKRFLENGIVAQFKESDFTSSDWRSLYQDDPDLDISPNDEFDEIQAKLELREEKRLAMLKARADELSTVRSDGGGAPSGGATTKSEAATVDNSKVAVSDGKDKTSVSV